MSGTAASGVVEEAKAAPGQRKSLPEANTNASIGSVILQAMLGTWMLERRIGVSSASLLDPAVLDFEREDTESMIELQVLGADDWQLWRDLRLESLRDAPDAFDSSLVEWLGPNDCEPLWRQGLEQPGSRHLVANADGRSVGMAKGLLKVPQVADLIALWVAPEFRRSGIGELLIDGVLSWARETSAKIVSLVVVEGNEAALALFSRCGFADTGMSYAGRRRMYQHVDRQRQPDAEETDSLE